MDCCDMDSNLLKIIFTNAFDDQIMTFDVRAIVSV